MAGSAVVGAALTVAARGADPGSVADERALAEAMLGPLVPRLAAEWARSGADESWRVLEGTLVFADISGFTALSEKLAARGRVGAEELTDVLGRCFTELLAVAYARGGSLVKFGGDALLLLFDGPEHAERGVHAALAMRARMREVGRLSTSVGTVHLRMSLGVHSGSIHAFRVGSSHRELLLVGPGASTVAEMEATADAGEVVVSPATASRVDAALLGEAKGTGVLLRARVGTPDAPEAGAYPERLAVGDVLASVPVALREHLLESGGESEHRQASIAFLHFDGTDGLLAARGPDWLAVALDELVRDAQAAAETHGVTFLASDVDHDGGKLILVAGVPRALGDDDGRLLRAVRQIAERERALPVRIGVHRGPVFAGEIGPAYRRTFTVMGDAVNLAARLMAKAERGQVLASPAVLERSRTAFRTTRLEPFRVKGKSRPVQAFLVGEPFGTQETRRSAALPLLGRERELERFEEIWAEVRSGRGRAVELRGDVGLGKTRLVGEIRDRARADGAELRLVECEQYEASTPFFAVRLLVGAALGGTDDLPARIAAVAPALAGWAPLVGDVLEVAVPETDLTRDLDPRFRRDRTTAVVIELLEAVVRGPAVLAFEDTQWIDDASATIVAALASTAARRPWLVVTTRRMDGGGLSLSESPWVDTIDVSPLGPEVAHALVIVATAEAPISQQRREALVQRAEGNVLFLEELLSAATDDADVELPDTIEAAVALQLDRLAPRDARLVRVAAVLGASFPAALLERLAATLDDLDGSGPDLAAALEGLHGLIDRESDGRIRFRHRLVRDVAYALLPYRRRAHLHGLAADAIAESSGDERDARAAILSLHLLHAQRFVECVAESSRAAHAARRRSANVEACRLYERALAAARRADPPPSAHREADLWVRLGTCRQFVGDFKGADDAYRRARKLRRGDPLVVADAAVRHAEVAERQGRPIAQARWLRHGLRALEGVTSTRAAVERAHLLNHYAFLRYRLGHAREALRWAQRAAQEAESAGAPGRGALATAFTVMDSVHYALGRPDRAVNGERALALYRQVRDRYNVALVQNNLGAFAYFEGRWSEALHRYDEARRTFERLGNQVDAALGSSNIAEIFADQGRLEEAERLLTDVVAIWRSLDFPLGLARATRYLARVHLRRGDAIGALELFDSARPTFATSGLVGNVNEVDVWRAECLLHLGRIDEADELLSTCLAQEQSAGTTEMRAMIHRLRSIAAWLRDDRVSAWAEVDESLAVARERGAAYDVALALETLSALARLGGRPVDEDARRERNELLQGLGVLAPPALPLPT